MIQRPELLQAVHDACTNDIVVSVMGAVQGWKKLPDYFFWVTAMGYGSSAGLGLALAQPERKVIVLDGDGSLLMNLGSLVTIANLQPENLIHIVLENGLWELPGSVPLPGLGKFSLTGLARASGLEKVHAYQELAEFREGLQTFLHEPGPFFATVQVAPGAGEGLPSMTLVELTRNLEHSLRGGKPD